MKSTEHAHPRWLLLIHQIPPQPGYLRTKIGRRLARLGAVALKNSVYILPQSKSSFEDFQWLRREIAESGGEATVVEAQFVDGLSDSEVQGLFCAARDVDYAGVADDLKALAKLAKGKLAQSKRDEIEGDIARIERRIAEIVSVDFFGASGREMVAGLVQAVRARIRPVAGALTAPSTILQEDYRARVWVTRTGIHVDRIASAWLIRKYIDEKAQFKYVPAKGYIPESGELRFDMFDAEFSHVGDLCTFEVLCDRFALKDPGLRGVADIIHDIDLKDGKHGRPETDGVAALVAGICLLNQEDEMRLDSGTLLFNQLLAYFSKKRNLGE